MSGIGNSRVHTLSTYGTHRVGSVANDPHPPTVLHRADVAPGGGEVTLPQPLSPGKRYSRSLVYHILQRIATRLSRSGTLHDPPANTLGQGEGFYRPGWGEPQVRVRFQIAGIPEIGH